MKIHYYFFTFFIFFCSNIYAKEDASKWLKVEIDKILIAYQNNDLPNENKFLMIEQTINNNFAGAGIAKFVSGQAWDEAPKEVKKSYIKNFKRHLALNIASMMQGYSNQKYELKNDKLDKKNKVHLINMEIFFSILAPRETVVYLRD